MKSKIKLNGGYVGLLMLIVGVAIIIFLVVRTDLFSEQKESKNMIDQANDYTDQARDAKDMLEKNRQSVVGE